MRYLIIGLGIYGTSLAQDLAGMGHEVIGVDLEQSRIQDVKDYISTTYQLDCTDESALSVLPLNGVDLVIVAIGENFGASIKTVALLKKHEVEHIYARAINDLHYAILECFNIERILMPEQASAHYLSQEMLLGTEMAALQITDDVFITKFAVPPFYYGANYTKMNLGEYGLQLIAVTRPHKAKNIIGLQSDKYSTIDLTDPSIIAEQGDEITVMATRKALQAMKKHIS